MVDESDISGLLVTGVYAGTMVGITGGMMRMMERAYKPPRQDRRKRRR